MATGIYKIQNLINGHVYIGQAVNINRRWTDEKRDAFNPNDKAYNYPISRAFRKYGIENFSFEIIEECEVSNLNERERYWVTHYNSFFEGYNQTLGGDGGHISDKKPKDYIIGIIKDLQETDMYHQEIADKWNVSREMVQGINTGRYWKQDNISYPLQTKHKGNSYHYNPITGEREVKKYYCQDCGKEIVTADAKRCVECAKIASRKVERPTPKELYNYLTTIKGNFTLAGKTYGVSDNAIRKWCVSYGLPSRSSDYQQKKEQKEKQWKSRKVLQLDIKTLTPIAEYENATEAAKAIDKPQGSSHISAVCLGKRKTAYGFSWKFKED